MPGLKELLGKENNVLQDDPVVSIVEELKASVEEEYGEKLQNLVNQIQKENSSSESRQIFKEGMNEVDRGLIGLELNTTISRLSKEVDIRIQDEENLKKYKSIEFTLLNKEIAERLEEINTIKDELNIFKTKEGKKLNTKRMAEYLYENHRDHYDRYISSRRYAVIQGIEKDVKKYERVYEKIPVLSRFYKMIVKLAS